MTMHHTKPDQASHLLANPDPAARASVRGARLGILLPVAISLLVGAIFVFVYLTAFHQPVPHRMPVAVVGDSATAARVLDLTDAPSSDEVAGEAYASVTEALDALATRGVFGVVDASSPTSTTLLYAGANGAAVRADLVSLLSPVTAANGMELTVTDALPLSNGDSGGLSIFYATFGLVLAGFLFGVNSYTAAPRLRLRQRLLSVSLFSVIGGVVIAAITGSAGFGAIPGDFFAVALVIALTAGAVATVTMVTLRLAGPVGTPIAVVLMLILGNATSGGVLPPIYLPEWMVPLNTLLPVGAGVRALQGVAYFSGAGVLSGLIVTVAWIVVCVGVLVLIDSRKARRRRGALELSADEASAVRVG